LNLVYVLPEWSLSCRMAQTMTLVAVGMMYSGGMPIINFFLMVYCFVAYWTDKWTILHGSRRPPLFRGKLLKVAADMFPLVAFLHCIITLWSFGNQDVFPSEWGWLFDFYSGLIGVSEAEYKEWIHTFYTATETQRETMDGVWSNYMRARILDMSRGSCWLLLLIFLFLILYWVVEVFLLQFLLKPVVKPLRVALMGHCRRRVIQEKEKDARSLQEAMGDMTDQGLEPTYSPEANDRYKAFLSSAASSEEVHKALEEHALSEKEKEKEKAREAKEQKNETNDADVEAAASS